MAGYPFIARMFSTAGAVLAVVGAVLWFAVPIRPMFPPYLATAVLAFAYGAWCRRKAAEVANPPKS